MVDASIRAADPEVVAPDLLAGLTARERRLIQSKFERVLASGGGGRRWPGLGDPLAIAQYLVTEGVLSALLLPNIVLGVVLAAVVTVASPGVVLSTGASAVLVLVVCLVIGGVPTQLRKMRIRRYFKRLRRASSPS